MVFFRKKPESFKRDRSLQEDYNKAESFNNFNNEDPDQTIVEKTFNKIKEEILLGNELLELFEEKCRATHIPVPLELINIRSAVKRKDTNEPEGARISFDLFITAVKRYEDLKLQYRLMISDTITGNADLDAEKINRLKTRVINGVNEEDFVIFTSLWLLNYCLNKYQDIFSIPTIMEIASSPESAAIGAIKFAAATAFASAVDVISSNLTADNRFNEVDDTISNVPEAQSLSRIDELALEKISENDYEVILDYAIKYIYSTNEQKYDPWISYMAVRTSRNNSVDMYSDYPTFSQKSFLDLNLNSEFTNDDLIENNILTRLKDDFERNFKDSISVNNTFDGSASQDMYRELSARNRMVFNTAAQASAYRMTKDQICCLMRILTKNNELDRETIKMIRCVIRATSKTISAQLSLGFSSKKLQAIKDIDIGAIAVNRMKGSISKALNRIYGGFVSKLESEISSEIYAKCYMFLNLQDGLLGGLEDIVNESIKMFNLEKSKISRDLENSSLVLQVKYQMRILNDMELILAAILDQSLEECALLEDDVADAIIDNAVSGFDTPSIQYTIDISDEMRKKYFSENQPIRLLKKTATFGRRSELVIPAIDKFNSPETSEEVVRNILRTCKIDITDEQIKQMLKDTDGSSR